MRLDVESGTDEALAHLHELGHRRIGLLRSAIRGETFDRRHVRWRDHLRANGEDPDDQIVVDTQFTAKATIDAAREWLARRGDTTAVLCDDDVIAAGMLAAAQAEGVDVPGELSVVGFDNLDLTRLTFPALTTVATDPEGWVPPRSSCSTRGSRASGRATGSSPCSSWSATRPGRARALAELPADLVNG